MWLKWVEFNAIPDIMSRILASNPILLSNHNPSINSRRARVVSWLVWVAVPVCPWHRSDTMFTLSTDRLLAVALNEQPTTWETVNSLNSQRNFPITSVAAFARTYSKLWWWVGGWVGMTEKEVGLNKFNGKLLCLFPLLQQYQFQF